MPGFTIVTFGCQMNQHDSERLGEVLARAGYDEAIGVADADVVILNTCSVREKGEQKLRSEVGRLSQVKAERPGLQIVVAGCVAQQEGMRILSSMPSVDVVIGPDNITELPGLLRDAELGAAPRVRTVFDLDAPEFLDALPRPGRVGPTAFVTTMKGCNERCSFCIVPTTRGPERYRPSADIVAEVRRLTEAGVKEVTLLGQTVNSYRDPSGALPAAPLFGEGAARFGKGNPEDETEFPALLAAMVAGAPQLARLRYMSPHPRHLTPALAAAHAALPVLAKHVHLPVQSGSPRVLKRMIRRYTVAEYEERLEMLREAVPGITFSTDIIVGFPGETRGDFDETLALVQRARFASLFAFKYSVRPFTPAQKLADDVPEAEKAARLAEILALEQQQKGRHLASLVGSGARVLVEGPSRGGGFMGRTERNDIVHFGAQGDPTGTLVDVVLTRAFRNSLEAELADASRAAPRNVQPQLPPTPSPTAAASPERRALPVI